MLWIRNVFATLCFDFYRAGLVFDSSENFKANNNYRKGKKKKRYSLSDSKGKTSAVY